jgi:hypothetical protein
MSVNSTIEADQNGEYDDWIELFNSSSSVKDITGYYLSDSKKNIKKWQFPHGTSISGSGYLIIWADKDTTQIGLHSNFKLSSLGEKLLLSKLELSYSRHPNGTGSFIWQNPTFNRTNDSK